MVLIILYTPGHDIKLLESEDAEALDEPSQAVCCALPFAVIVCGEKGVQQPVHNVWGLILFIYTYIRGTVSLARLVVVLDGYRFCGRI